MEYNTSERKATLGVLAPAGHRFIPRVATTGKTMIQDVATTLSTCSPLARLCFLTNLIFRGGAIRLTSCESGIKINQIRHSFSTLSRFPFFQAVTWDFTISVHSDKHRNWYNFENGEILYP